MRKSIDNAALRNEYAAELAREERWVGAAKELLASAKLMESLIVERERALLANALDETEYPTGQDFRPVYFMLVAYACENILKAALVRQSKNDLKTQAQKAGRLPNSLRGHDLCELAVAAGLSPSERLELLLRRLTRNAVWAGRYPLPLDAIEFYGDTNISDAKTKLVAFFLSDDVSSAKQIVSWLENSLGLSLSETVA